MEVLLQWELQLQKPSMERKKKQAGAELYQAQFKLGLAKHGLSS